MRTAILVLAIILMLTAALHTETIELGLGGVTYWGDGYFFRGAIGPEAYLSLHFMPKIKMVFGLNWIRENNMDRLPWYIPDYPFYDQDDKLDVRYNARLTAYNISFLYNFLNQTALGLWVGPSFNHSVQKVKAHPLFSSPGDYEGKISRTGIGVNLMVQTGLSHKIPVKLNLSGSFLYWPSEPEDDHFITIFGNNTYSADLRLSLSYSI